MSAYADLLERCREVAALRGAASLMSWDQQVLMPQGGASARAAHVGRLRRLAHERLTSDEMLLSIERAEQEVDMDSDEGRSIAALRRELESESKLPTELVVRKASLSSDAYETWKVAKATNDFPLLAPHLKGLFDVARESAEHLGYESHPYDALINLYEHGANYSEARKTFDDIKEPIVSLVREISSKPEIDDGALRGEFDPESLRRFAQRTAATIGFDFGRGRLDVCTNAFCSGTGNSDVRMTTRPSKHVKGIVSSSLHEMGHGLYEQGSPTEWNDTPLAGGVSLAVHESQSRLWENVIGRSHGFWARFLPDLKREFPRIDLDADGMVRAMNVVRPEFVRVGADELTYNLHILVRFELEVEIVTNQVSIDDLPEAWNAKYSEYLGITPPTNTLGCLQDVHWSRGSVGYFPTYTFGNLIGLQMWERLCEDVPDPDSLMAKGDFGPILGWLTERVYRQGKRYAPRELVTRVTGSPMKPDAWLRYAKEKYGALYGL
ncbi:carboxypeptidase M32 [bacterium]|nr:MAG: carboxypeptidase M32 [bacterium]